MAVASHLDIERCKLIPLSLSSFCACPCSCRPLSSKFLVLSRPITKFGHLRLVLDGPQAKGSIRLSRSVVSVHRHFITAMARAEPESLDEGNAKQEVDKGQTMSMNEDTISQSQPKKNQLKKRVVFGLGIGVTVGGVVLAGGWVFTMALAAAVFVGAREYFELVRSRGITAGMTPPPRYVSRVCSVICALMPILTLYLGQIDVSVTSAAFVLATALLLQRGNPRFAQLSSAMFGLFYCGYLPCFWVKLRCGLAAPALNTGVGRSWPVLLGGQAHWTVGLVATLISFSSIIAADTCAFMGGKAIGRTPLTSVSPKKTWEGTIVGLGGCIAISAVLSRVFSWPRSLPSAIAFGILNFFGSIFGDLTEPVYTETRIQTWSAFPRNHSPTTHMATVSKLGALTPLPYSNLKLKQQLPLLEFSSIIFKHSHLSLPNVTLKRLRNASPLPLIRAQSSADYFPDSKFYKVEAIVRPWRVQKVSSALLKMGIRGVTVSDVRGFGSQGGSTERQGGSEFSEDDFVGKVKMEIVVSKDQVEAVIDKIIDEARTGEIGDGKIFLVPVSDVIRVRTGERGEKAERMTGGLSDMFSNA